MEGRTFGCKRPCQIQVAREGELKVWTNRLAVYWSGEGGRGVKPVYLRPVWVGSIASFLG